ncbi:MAG: DUF2089 domain-containing protein [Anaerolineaceae bacterium]|nr:DUF2089 domain-containing protein [Anaerolineaceae bacterium]
MTETRESILKQFENGEITIEEADRLLVDLELTAPQDATEDPIPEEDESRGSAIPADFNRFKWAWVWFLFGGIILTLIGAFGMYDGYQSRGLGAGFWFSWIPLSLGVCIVILAINSKNSLWIHVRVNTGKKEWPRRIKFSIPLPLQLTRLTSRLALKYDVDGRLNASDVDEIIAVIKESDTPLAVYVDEDDGEKVQVFIGK